MIRHVVPALLVLSLSATAAAEGPDIVRASQPIPGRYIVVFKESVGDVEKEAHALAGDPSSVRHVYKHGLKGFSASMNEQRARALLHNPNIDFIQEDSIISLDEVRSVTEWGLDRIDQRDLPLDATYTQPDALHWARVFVMDTGILAAHQEFGDRVVGCWYGFNDGQQCNDCHGHGTHVAGTIGGATVGVAKYVQLVPVRVLDCGGSGSTEVIIAGIDWINYVTASQSWPAVVNMSLSTENGRNMAMEAAIAASINSYGLTYVVSASNEAADACGVSPAAVPGAITVGATTDEDALASFSNFGSCVDILAPGVGIRSASNAGTDQYTWKSGTSMAAPHVAGAAALYQGFWFGASPAQVTQSLLSRATPGRITGAPAGTPNLLLHTGCPAISGEITPELPTACVGGNITLTFNVEGDSPLSYRWYRRTDFRRPDAGWTEIADGGNISGAKTATLTIQNASYANASYYMAMAWNACQTTDSASVYVRVAPLPVATVSGDATACPGASSTITATMTEGLPPYKLVWSDGFVQSGVTGAWWDGPIVATRTVSPTATTTYTVTSIHGGHGGLNDVESTCAGSASGSATITIQPRPAISSFSPVAGPAGTQVILNGTGFAAATGVTFNGTAATFTIDSNTRITTMVPNGATTGTIVVTTATCSSAPSTPFTVTELAATSIVATAISPTQATITWGAVGGATQYEIGRRAGPGPFTVIGTSTGTSFTDSSCAAGKSYLYQVRPLSASGFGPYSNPDIATTIFFTNAPLIPAATIIKAVHTLELRTAVNAARALAGLTPIAFTDAAPTGLPIRADHLRELRNALGPARTALGLAAIAYTDPSLSLYTTPVRAAHFEELRAGVR